jgi:hypothetical protein
MPFLFFFLQITNHLTSCPETISHFKMLKKLAATELNFGPGIAAHNCNQAMEVSCGIKPTGWLEKHIKSSQQG